MSIQESIVFRKEGEIGFIEFDLIGEKVNKLSGPVMVRFNEVLGEVENSEVKALILLSKKKSIFIAGADIEEIKRLNSKEAFAEAIDRAHEILNRLEDLKIPSIAAIHGSCLGGGCELVLACDYRFASDAKETQIGLPEVKLGIFPGFGGCLRLPRLIGIPAALDIILAGKSVAPYKAKKIGLIDESIPEKVLIDRATAFARELILKGGSGKKKQNYQPKSAQDKFLNSFLGRPVVFSQAKKTVLKNTKGFYPAPMKALEVIQKTYGYGDRSKAIKIEKDAFCEVAVTDVSKNLINLFFMMEAVKKQTGVTDPSVKPRKVSQMAVLGAGTMGGGIAQLGADKGVDVRMKDISNEALALGFKAAHDIWAKKLKKRRLTKFEYAQKAGRISGSLTFEGFQTIDLVVEAIVEDMGIKKKVIAEAAEKCGPETIIATNTSSLSVTEMAEAHPRPENFAGMHFFNPVHMMPLVEVIRGPKTSDETAATVFELSKKMGKTPVMVKDGPGFLVNRLLMPYMIEAMFLLKDGMSVQKVDRWYTHEFGMPMGPYRLMDEVGLDVCVKVAKIFKASLGERIELPDFIDQLSDPKRLGKKTGLGFYKYDDRGKEIEVDESVYGALGLSSPSNPLDKKECLDRGLFVMINEASLALIQDKIVDSPESVDLAMIMGTGFPPFRGGLLKYADSRGSESIAQDLEMLASKYSGRFKPSAPLQNLAKSNKKFYS